MFGLLTRPGDLGLEVLSNRFRTMLDGIEGAPSIDLFEGPQGWTLYAEVPGARPEDVTVQVENSVLSLEVKKTAPEVGPDQTPLLRERSFGAYRREVSLPDGVDTARIEAQVKDGVLTLTLPKREDAKPKKIEIQVR